MRERAAFRDGATVRTSASVGRPAGQDAEVRRLGRRAVGRRVEDDGPYAEYNAAVAEMTGSYTTGALGKLACSAEAVGETILKALSSDKPKARYRVASSAGLFMTMRWALPDVAFDAFLRSGSPVPKPKKA